MPNRQLRAARLLALVGALALLASVSAVNAVTPTVSVSNITFTSVGQNVQDSVSVANMPSFSSYQVSVKVDPSLLNPTSIDFSKGILPSPSIVLECINGIRIAGPSCAGVPGNGPGQVTLVLLSSSSVSGSGLLFTVNYTTVKDPGCGSPINLESPTEFVTATGAPISGITVVNGEYTGTCSSVPQFSFGLAVLLAIAVPSLLILRRRALPQASPI